jgi:hypothetical protein
LERTGALLTVLKAVVLRIVLAFFLLFFATRLVCKGPRALTLAFTGPFAALLAWAVALSAEGWWRGTPTQDIFWLGDFELAVLLGLVAGSFVLLIQGRVRQRTGMRASDDPAGLALFSRRETPVETTSPGTATAPPRS